MQKLSFMDFRQLLHTLDLNDDLILYNDICPVLSNDFTFVKNLDRNLACCFQSPLIELNHQGIFVDLLQEAMSQDPVHFKYCAIDSIRDFIEIHHTPHALARAEETFGLDIVVQPKKIPLLVCLYRLCASVANKSFLLPPDLDWYDCKDYNAIILFLEVIANGQHYCPQY